MKILAGKILIPSNSLIIFPFSGLISSISSISFPKKWILYAVSEYPGYISTTSPFTLKLPLWKSDVVLKYNACTKDFNKLSLDSICSEYNSNILSWKSSGFPIPYIHETDATTITSLLPDNKAEVVLNLNFSISSFIERSFSI